jgi:flavin reductase (DIM6/NTAB) family NADH-FMN oxidoreductase RutF
VARLTLDPADLGAGIYPWLNSVVLPRPIAWISTTSASGVDNLAPHSFFTIAGVVPPVLSFTSVGTKDTLRNIQETGEFVVCVSPEPMLEQVNASATDFPAGVSEYDVLGIEREAAERVRPPRVAASPVAAECRLLQTVVFGDCTVVFGEVVLLAVQEAVLRDGRPASDLLAPLARLGANEWSTLGEVTSHRRVPYAEWSA